MLKNSRACVAFIVTLTIGGCVASQPLPTPGTDHPANPDAAQVAPLPESNTLSTQPTMEPASRPATAPMEGHHHGH